MELHSIKTASGKQPDDGTMLTLGLGTKPGFVRITRQKPGQPEEVLELPIIDGTVTLPD